MVSEDGAGTICRKRRKFFWDFRFCKQFHNLYSIMDWNYYVSRLYRFLSKTRWNIQQNNKIRLKMSIFLGLNFDAKFVKIKNLTQVKGDFWNQPVPTDPWPPPSKPIIRLGDFRIVNRVGMENHARWNRKYVITITVPPNDDSSTHLWNWSVHCKVLRKTFPATWPLKRRSLRTPLFYIGCTLQGIVRRPE